MWQTPAELHAALNDLPAVLLLLTLAFEVAGGITRRESLRAAGFWTLVIGAVGALLALVSGLRAESTIEHGGSVHMVMERHETLAITVTVLYGVLAAWRIWRRTTMAGRERNVYLLGLGLGALLVIWTSHVGGTVVFRHGGGVPTSVLEGALAERTVPHTHGPGEEHGSGTEEADSAAAGEHEHAPGTPEHEHD